MSLRQTTNDIDKMMTGIEVQEAVDLTIAYIRKTEKFSSDEAAHGWWSGLDDTEKIQILLKALRQ